MVEHRLSKKYIKRLFHKPHKTRCRDCGSNMFLLPEDEFPGKILFRCVSKDCGHVIDVTEYKKTMGMVLDKSKMSRAMVPFNAKELVNLSRTIIHYRIQDKWYIIDDNTTYNPILRTKFKDRQTYKISDDIHKELVEIIIKGLQDAQK